MIFVLGWKLTDFWFSYWGCSVSNTNLIALKRINFLCFSCNDVLFAHMEVNATVFFETFVQSSFGISWSQKRRITIWIFASGSRWIIIHLFTNNFILVRLLDIHTSKIMMIKCFFSSDSFAWLLLQHHN